MPTTMKVIYTLQQQVYCASLPGVQVETAVFFQALNEDELREVVTIFEEGGEDERIVEQQPPEPMRPRPDLRARLIRLIAPDGSDLSGLFPELPFVCTAEKVSC